MYNEFDGVNLCRAALVPAWVVAPGRKWNWTDALLPAVCSVVEIERFVEAYHPRPARFPSSNFSSNSSKPLVGGGGAAVTDTVAVPVFPDDVAVIVAEPALTPDTTPDALTDATEELLD